MENQQILHNKYETIIIILGMIVSLVFAFYKIKMDRKKRAKLEELSKLKYEKLKRVTDENEIVTKQNLLNERISRLESLKTRMDELILIEAVDISDYKEFIEENQSNILQKGNEDILFSFLKIDSFLKNYKQGMESCKRDIIKKINVDFLKSKLIENSKINDLDKLAENLQSNLNRLDGEKALGFNASFDRLVSTGHVFKGTYENYNKTLDYYKNIAKAMVVFYLNDNKIGYFEIYQAFEKLGVFDSTWQKNLMDKMSNIENNLSKISNDLTKINSNFEQLISQSEKITNELKSINSSVQTGNMIQVISAYQLWRVNRKINN